MGTVNKEEQLERITDALEAIAKTLIDIEADLDRLYGNIDSCMSRTDRGNFLCITGNVSTY